MRYRYKGGFLPRWYKERNIKNYINKLKLYLIIIIIINGIFAPFTINKLMTNSKNNEDNFSESMPEVKKQHCENSQVKALKWFINDKFYDNGTYKLIKEGKTNLSITLEDINNLDELKNSLNKNKIKFSSFMVFKENTEWKASIDID